MNKYFIKSKQDKKIDHIANAELDRRTAEKQGNYTDHNMTPYQLRNQMSPMGKDEREKFDKVMAKYAGKFPNTSFSDLLIFATEDGYFYVDENDGMLKVSEEEPELTYHLEREDLE